MKRAAADDVLITPAVVVGSGVAGMVAALAAAPKEVVLVTRSRDLPGGSSVRAQGGVAVALGASDDPALHARDTIEAAAGLADLEAVRVLVREGPDRVRWLLGLGARFDRDSRGGLQAGREGAHSVPRILHASGDATGAEMVRALALAVRTAPHIRIVTDCLATRIMTSQGGKVTGLAAVDARGRRILLRSGAVVLATGGCGGVFLRTTNPPGAIGTGLSLAWRAGAQLADLEMVQFHPTALDAGDDPLQLLTEALRGEGAYLINDGGDRFMLREHPQAELAPRDVVARAIWKVMEAGGRVWLDARHLGNRLEARFPTVCRLAGERGLDPKREPLPVTPAAHYHMGGVVIDLLGRATVPGLWACGEVACTGVHGANRLASNSLLEALVFGWRAGKSVAETVGRAGRENPDGWPEGSGRLERLDTTAVELVMTVRQAMWRGAGLIRDAEGLNRALDVVRGVVDRIAPGPSEERFLVETAGLILASAERRRHSLGAQSRRDFPEGPAGEPQHLLVQGERRFWGRLGACTRAAAKGAIL